MYSYGRWKYSLYLLEFRKSWSTVNRFVRCDLAFVAQTHLIDKLDIVLRYQASLALIYTFQPSRFFRRTNIKDNRIGLKGQFWAVLALAGVKCPNSTALAVGNGRGLMAHCRVCWDGCTGQTWWCRIWHWRGHVWCAGTCPIVLLSAWRRRWAGTPVLSRILRSRSW